MKLERAMEIVKAIAEAGNNKFDELSKTCSEEKATELSLQWAANKLIEMQSLVYGTLREVTEFLDSEIPSKSCECHDMPPCKDCMEYGHIREEIEYAKKQYES